MDCQSYQKILSEHLDGEAAPEAIVVGEAHLQTCPKCARIYSDIRAIVREARVLELEEPPERVWVHLRRQLLDEGLMREKRVDASAWEKMKLAFAPPRMWATATIASLLLVGVATLWYLRSTPPSPEVTREAVALNEVKMAEHHCLKAIQDLENVTRDRLGTLDPSLRTAFEDNLATMDYYIDKCQETIKNEPTNVVAQEYLLQAYRKKVELLESILRSDLM